MSQLEMHRLYKLAIMSHFPGVVSTIELTLQIREGSLDMVPFRGTKRLRAGLLEALWG